MQNATFESAYRSVYCTMNNPILLQKQLKQNSSDLVEYCNELKKWGQEIKEKEKGLKNEKEVEYENVETAEAKKTKKSVKFKKVAEVKSKVPKSAEYWDKLNVDTTSEEDSDLTDEFDNDIIATANEEKEKGNNSVKRGDFAEAIVHYTEAISLYKYDPVFYANRALCYNKLQDFRNAEADCTTALQIENDYVKALHRRAVARKSLGQLKEAKEDLQRVLVLEPNNKESQILLDVIKKKIEPEDQYQKPVSKFTLSRKNKGTPKSGTSSASSSVPGAEIAVKQHIVERKRPTETAAKPASIQGIVGEKPAESSQKFRKFDSEVSWPSGQDVEVVESVFKSAKERSKGRMKRLTVFAGEARLGLKKNHEKGAEVTMKLDVDERKLPEDKKLEVEKEIVLVESNEVGPNHEETILAKNQNFANWTASKFADVQAPVARNSIQFYKTWKTLSTADRTSYLMQINPLEFKNIFKDNLENTIFSQIIHSLGPDEQSFECLYGLTRVNRFSTMVMFANKEDTLCLQKLWKELEKTCEKYSKEELEYVFMKKYKVKI